MINTYLITKKPHLFEPKRRSVINVSLAVPLFKIRYGNTAYLMLQSTSNTADITVGCRFCLPNRFGKTAPGLLHIVLRLFRTEQQLSERRGQCYCSRSLHFPLSFNIIQFFIVYVNRKQNITANITYRTCNIILRRSVCVMQNAPYVKFYVRCCGTPWESYGIFS